MTGNHIKWFMLIIITISLTHFVSTVSRIGIKAELREIKESVQCMDEQELTSKPIR